MTLFVEERVAALMRKCILRHDQVKLLVFPILLSDLTAAKLMTFPLCFVLADANMLNILMLVVPICRLLEPLSWL